jgi:DNA-binding Lrp family transcriptional regulator
MDRTDSLILSELQEDSRRTLTLMSKKLGIPRTTILSRIRALKKEGIIKKFTIIPDHTRLGRPTTAFVLASYLPTAKISQREVAKRISHMEGVFEVHLISGEWDMIIKLRAESMEKVGEIVIDRLREIEGVGRTVTCGSFASLKEEF